MGLKGGALDIGVHIADLLDQVEGNFSDDGTWREFCTVAVIAVTNRETVRRRLFSEDGRALDIAFAPLSDASVLMSVRDVTDTNNVEKALLERNAALEEANRLKTDFLANTSYELRTPLTSISGFAELLSIELSGPLNPIQKGHVDGILAASSALSQLIDSILEVSTEGLRGGDILVTEIAVRPVLDSMVSITRPQIEASGTELEVEFIAKSTAGPPTLQADERRFRQLVFNLVTSARRHDRSGDRIMLQCSYDADSVTLTVFLKSELPRLERHSIENELGLTLVQRLASMLGGKVVLTKAVGAPAILSCVLPRRPGLSVAGIAGRQVPAPQVETVDESAG
jgi:signal transduction histidine kinase